MVDELKMGIFPRASTTVPSFPSLPVTFLPKYPGSRAIGKGLIRRAELSLTEARMEGRTDGLVLADVKK